MGQMEENVIGSLAGKVRIKGDILSTGTKWDATLTPTSRSTC